jgi:hypothetical protein
MKLSMNKKYMSEEFWRPFEFEMELGSCDICGNDELRHMEAKNLSEQTVIRFLCDDCWYKRGQSAPVVTRQLGENEKVEETTRPAWMEKFIADSEGNLQTIGQTDSDGVEDNEIGDQDLFEDSEEEDVIPADEKTSKRLSVAPWSAGFIQESLFGANPYAWLENQGALKEEQLQTTIKTLAALLNNQTGGVRLSAINCLGNIGKANNADKENIKALLNTLNDDEDELVKQMAESTINQL